MRRLRPGSTSPAASRNSARSEGSSWAISASMAPQMRTTSECSSRGALFDQCGVFIALVDTGFVDVGDVKHRLHCDEEEVTGDNSFIVGQVGDASGLARVEDGEKLLQGLGFGLRGGRGGLRFGGFLGFDAALFDGVEIGEQELGIDDVDVVERRDLAGDVDDLVVVEAAHHVEDSVCLADVREELVAEAFAFACAFDDARDVDELHGGGDDGVGLDVFDDAVEAGVGDGDHADIRVDGAERVVGGGCGWRR